MRKLIHARRRNTGFLHRAHAWNRASTGTQNLFSLGIQPLEFLYLETRNTRRINSAAKKIFRPSPIPRLLHATHNCAPIGQAMTGGTIPTSFPVIKKSMKRSFVLVGMLALALTACGEKQEAAAPQAAPAAAPVAEAAAPVEQAAAPAAGTTETAVTAEAAAQQAPAEAAAPAQQQ
ncbi:MAG: hypothetical protein AB7U81_00695 [Thiohalomonadaceae bacterium]